VPLGPSPDLSNSAVISSSRQCSGNHAAAKESYLHPNFRASAVELPQSHPLGPSRCIKEDRWYRILNSPQNASKKKNASFNNLKDLEVTQLGRGPWCPLSNLREAAEYSSSSDAAFSTLIEIQKIINGHVRNIISPLVTETHYLCLAYALNRVGSLHGLLNVKAPEFIRYKEARKLTLGRNSF